MSFQETRTDYTTMFTELPNKSEIDLTFADRGIFTYNVRKIGEILIAFATLDGENIDGIPVRLRGSGQNRDEIDPEQLLVLGEHTFIDSEFRHDPPMSLGILQAVAVTRQPRR